MFIDKRVYRNLLFLLYFAATEPRLIRLMEIWRWWPTKPAPRDGNAEAGERVFVWAFGS